MEEQFPEGWEAWLAFFSASLPQPVEHDVMPDGSVVFRAGDPGEVIVHLMPRTITVSLFQVRRLGARGPLIVARPVARVSWQRLPLEDATRVVETLIAAARSARRATFRVCEVCERTKPPEDMRTANVCASCAAGSDEPPATIH